MHTIIFENRVLLANTHGKYHLPRSIVMHCVRLKSVFCCRLGVIVWFLAPINGIEREMREKVVRMFSASGDTRKMSFGFPLEYGPTAADPVYGLENIVEWQRI